MPAKKCLLLFLLISTLSTTLYAETPDWSDYERLLQEYISPQSRSGITLHWLDYSGLQKDAAFQSVVDSLSRFPLAKLEGRDEILSFYINAYNILAIKTVLDNWPLQSIKDVGSWLQPVWDKPAGHIDGRVFSLGMIEHEILRKLNEPRIHMAIVCASLSCPDLRRQAYRAETLSQQLQAQTAAFLANKSKGLRLDGNTVHVSKIFDWFEDDFAASGGVETFIRNYVKLPESSRIKTDIRYNWSLNGG